MSTTDVRPLFRGTGGRTGPRALPMAGAVVALLLSGCSASAPGEAPAEVDSVDASADTASPDDDATAADAVTAESIAAYIADAEWSFAAYGLDSPELIPLAGGTYTDDLARVYEVGDGVEGDANGDGVVDLAVPISQLDGNGFQELWYIWLGVADAEPNGPVATQLVYPVALSTRCGDAVHSVTAIDTGFSIDETLWLTNVDDNRDCASGGTGTQTREVTVSTLEGASYPVQTAPVDGWGGVCPRSEWIDGLPETEAAGYVAPTVEAPEAFSAGETVWVYELPSAPLVTESGATFFGFQSESLMVDSQEEAEALPVRMHCAFAL